MFEDSENEYEDVLSWITLSSSQRGFELFSYLLNERLHEFKFPKKFDFYYSSETIEIVRQAYRRRGFRKIGTENMRGRLMEFSEQLQNSLEIGNSSVEVRVAAAFFEKALLAFLEEELVSVDSCAPSETALLMVPIGAKVLSQRVDFLKSYYIKNPKEKIYIDLIVRSEFFARELCGRVNHYFNSLSLDRTLNVVDVIDLLHVNDEQNLQGEILIEYVAQGDFCD